MNNPFILKVVCPIHDRALLIAAEDRWGPYPRAAQQALLEFNERLLFIEAPCDFCRNGVTISRILPNRKRRPNGVLLHSSASLL